MPLYEYECRTCKVHTDVRHGFDEKNTDACPACGGELARVFGASGIVFKGSGFYINDSRKPAASESGSSSSTGGSSSSGTGTSPGTAAAPASPTPDAPSASSAPATTSGGDAKPGSGATAA